MVLFGMFGSPLQMMIVLVIILLLFGNRLPSTMRSLGRGVTEFKKGLAGEGESEEEAGQSKDKQVKKDEPSDLR
jgi:sec-independent protein translocase protein TatA